MWSEETASQPALPWPPQPPVVSRQLWGNICHCVPPAANRTDQSSNMTASLLLLQAVPVASSPIQSSSHLTNNKTFKSSCHHSSLSSSFSSSPSSSSSRPPALLRKMSSRLEMSRVVSEPHQWAGVGRELRSLADSLGPGATTTTTTTAATAGIHWEDLGPVYSSLCSLVLGALIRNISNKIFSHLKRKII